VPVQGWDVQYAGMRVDQGKGPAGAGFAEECRDLEAGGVVLRRERQLAEEVVYCNLHAVSAKVRTGVHVAPNVFARPPFMNDAWYPGTGCCGC
jgi:hypothetical protein